MLDKAISNITASIQQGVSQGDTTFDKCSQNSTTSKAYHDCFVAGVESNKQSYAKYFEQPERFVALMDAELKEINGIFACSSGAPKDQAACTKKVIAAYVSDLGAIVKSAIKADM